MYSARYSYLNYKLDIVFKLYLWSFVLAYFDNKVIKLTYFLPSSFVSPSPIELYVSINSLSEMLTGNLCGYGWLLPFFRSSTAALRILKYSLGLISSSLGLSTFLLDSPLEAASAAFMASFSSFSLAF